jgi:putative transposase
VYQFYEKSRLRVNGEREEEMIYFRKKYWNKTARVADWDYGSNAIYFIRIGTKDKKEYFSLGLETQNFASHAHEVLSKKLLIPSEIGLKAIQYWKEIPDHFPFVKLDRMILTSNQLHAIFSIVKPGFKEWKTNKFGPQTRNLASIIRGYKAAVRKYATLTSIEFSWAERYDEKLIQNNRQLEKIRNYLLNYEGRIILCK